MVRRPSTQPRKLEKLAWRNAARSILAPLLGALRDAGFRPAEVSALLAESQRADSPGGEVDLPLSYELATRLISRWLLEPRFSKGGAPRELPLHGQNSFATLCQNMAAEPSEILRELKRVHAVVVTDDKVRLTTEAYVPASGKAEKLDILGRDGAEFLRMMIHNVGAPSGKAMLQRRASYDNIGAGSLTALREELRAEGQRAVLAANHQLAEVDRDRNPAAPAGRRTKVSFGVYVFEEAVAPVKKPTRKTRRRKGAQS